MKYIEIRLTKCCLYFTEAELQRMLAREPELWAEGLKRGKGIRRAQAMEARMQRRNGDTPA